ncbi:SRPBCC family protein [Methylobacterium sp. NEAU 140]|uniref:SRPBCC family protein n=1 Tax=Methylobacterium sp. NEAU 140 TaxID=3064945 RepID=UPI00273473C1|nr:SRPBCC family protein [Methylobacterium sp. NEAU 140]MDP4026196.1 SRPBCC family protein [Methylobacterium sp. NEAU 140]
MKKITLATAAMAALVAVTAQAHGPTRRKTAESIEINAPADKVFKVAADWKDAGWMQGVTKTETQGDDPAKSKRTLTLKSGNTMVQTGGKYKPDDRLFMFYIDKVDVKDLPANDYSGTITVEPQGDAKSKVEWKAAFYRGYMNNDPPAELNDENSEKAVKAWMKQSLENLKAKVEKGS